jgi:hypothetical protein
MALNVKLSILVSLNSDALYYGSDLPKMRNSEKKKSKESTESQEGEEQEKKEEDVHDDTIKHASRKNGYTICQKNKLGKLST